MSGHTMANVLPLSGEVRYYAFLKKERKKRKTLALFDFWVVAHHHLW